MIWEILAGVIIGITLIAFYKQGVRQTTALRGCEMALGRISEQIKGIGRSPFS